MLSSKLAFLALMEIRKSIKKDLLQNEAVVEYKMKEDVETLENISKDFRNGG